MEKFSYTIKDPEGIHARPATSLVMEAKKYQASISIRKGKDSADAKRIFSVMALGAKQGEKLAFEISGPDEKEATAAIKKVVAEVF